MIQHVKLKIWSLFSNSPLNSPKFWGSNTGTVKNFLPFPLKTETFFLTVGRITNTMSTEVPDDHTEYSHIIRDIAKQGRC